MNGGSTKPTATSVRTPCARTTCRSSCSKPSRHGHWPNRWAAPPARATVQRDSQRHYTTPAAGDLDKRRRDGRQLAKQLLNTAFLKLPSCPHGAEGRSRTLPTAPTALDAVLMAGARAADQAGFTAAGKTDEPPLWSEDWWGRAEQGVLMWHVTTSQLQDGELKDGRYRQVHGALEDILQRPAPIAIKCASHFIMQILAQTGRAQVFHSQMPGTIHGIKIPPRLWRALGEAGPHPDPRDPFEGNRWWYVEIEEPEPEEARGFGDLGPPQPRRHTDRKRHWHLDRRAARKPRGPGRHRLADPGQGPGPAHWLRLGPSGTRPHTPMAHLGPRCRKQ